ncbi:lipopolysaccharide biosynthesis protein [Bacteroidia bacterium]|nr:lipopolysaccharide biosynthesis protein [Bacteroidia bacterium]
MSNSSVASNLKNGFFWNSLSQFASQGMALLSMMVLGRLLNPEDFGVLGMFAIFIVIANMIVDSGMGASLIIKADVSAKDYSTLFLYNLIISMLLYLILFFTAPVIANFYKTDILIQLIRVVALLIIIHAFSIVQNIRILKEMKFKALAIINFISAFISLIISIIFATKGYGIWSLVIQQISMALCTTVLMCCYNRFIPSIVFSIKSFKEQFAFGINLMLSNFLQILTNNVTSNVMAKITTLNQTGYFVQSNKLTGSVNQIVTVVIDRTIFPVFAKIDDTEKIKQAYINLRKNIFSIFFPLYVLLALLSKPILRILFGAKWIDAAWMLNILAFSLIPLTIQMLCRNILKSRGNTKQIFYNEIIKSILLILSIVTGMFLGIKYFLWSIVVSQSIACLWIMYSVSKEIQYNYWQYLSSTLILVGISLFSYYCTAFIMNNIHIDNPVLSFLFGIALILLFVLLLSYALKQKEIFNLIRKVVNTKINK